MATIVKRRDRFCVVYMYTDSKGARKQKWETYKTQAEAKVRLKEIEYKEQIGTFVVPQCKTLDDLLREYISLSVSIFRFSLSLQPFQLSRLLQHLSTDPHGRSLSCRSGRE